MAPPSDQSRPVKQREVLPLPSMSEFFKPRWFFGFLKAFLGSWLTSRQLKTMILAFPAIVVLVAGSFLAWQLAAPPRAALAAAYERAAVKASELESYEESDLLWERLMQLRPDDNAYRFMLATSLVEREEYDAATPHLDLLTIEKGYAPACLWLVRQSRDNSSKLTLTPEQQIFQLQKVVKEEPDNEEAHRLLAQTYMEREDYRVAEQHLLRVVDRHPTLGLLLFELQLLLQRTDDNSRRYLERARTAYAGIVQNDPLDVQSRIYWSQALIYLDQSVEAERILTEALRTINSPALRATTAEFMVRQAQNLVQRSPLNAPIAAKYVAKAAQFQADYPELASMFVELLGMGAEFSEEDLEPVLDELRTRLESDSSDLDARVSLARLLASVGQHTESAELLEPYRNANADVQSLLARIYMTLDRPNDAVPLLDSMLADLRRLASEQPEDPELLTELVNGLIIGERASEAVTTLETFSHRTSQELHELPTELRELFVIACVIAFKEIDQEDLDDRAFTLLSTAAKARRAHGAFVELLAELAYSEGPLVQQSNDLLTGILASGQANAHTYLYLGTKAMSAGKTESAISHLERAMVQSPRNPVIQNNLAIALVRQSPDNAATAVNLCTEALKIAPGHPDILSTRAEANIARRRWKDARNDLEIALPNRDRSAELHRLLIKVYEESDEFSRAAEHKRILDEILSETSEEVP